MTAPQAGRLRQEVKNKFGARHMRRLHLESGHEEFELNYTAISREIEIAWQHGTWQSPALRAKLWIFLLQAYLTYIPLAHLPVTRCIRYKHIRGIGTNVSCPEDAPITSIYRTISSKSTSISRHKTICTKTNHVIGNKMSCIYLMA